MSVDRDTVTGVVVEATLRVDVPVDRGDELAAGAQDVLESLDRVRWAGVLEIGPVDAGDEGLSASVDCRLALHVDASTDDAQTARRTLLGLDRVLEIDRFEPVDGPYRIERR